MGVKLRVARHCPLASLLTEDEQGGDLELAEGEIKQLAAASQSFFCYLDNFDTFNEAEKRARMKKKVEVYRIRYDEGMTANYILEKKSYFPQGSKKSRESTSVCVPIPDYALNSFLNGEFSKEEYAQELSVMGETEAEKKRYLDEFVKAQNHIVTNKLAPVFSTRCQKTEFEIKQPHLRFCLEENIVLTKHTKYFTGFDKENLMRQTSLINPSTAISHEKFDDLERLSLPSAILSVSVDDSSYQGQEDFTWLKEILEMPELIKIQSFSKWIFGCAMLMPDKTAKPKWLGEYLRLFAPSVKERGFKLTPASPRRLPQPVMKKKKKDPQKREREESLLALSSQKRDSNEGRVREDGDYEFPSLISRLGAALTGEEEDVYIIGWSKRYDEPKTYLANERVFCHWMKKVIIVAGYAIYLFKSGLSMEDNGVDLFASLCLFLLGLGSLTYALYLFRWRAKRITNFQIDRPVLDGYNKDIFFEDNYGPFLFFFVMALIASLLTIIINHEEHPPVLWVVGEKNAQNAILHLPFGEEEEKDYEEEERQVQGKSFVALEDKNAPNLAFFYFCNSNQEFDPDPPEKDQV
eukprot:CAMPEP_0201540064 /NCGR_PEP_ID=MMETSP0161_2-20130828/70741_1 /ASSEMBLY_ACC=CAM_ASM_000251 /TAXON_ID=180227 /ORGANISM="Neoparamoeba aestuarina, Strain SoJaBio B1-5/56/2" /LENGTH=578 /DNA_ID=CAMNT_0047947509 /DNA_START=684 /DNA_END=2420 /DNA_ORIENTATION=-